MPLSEVEVDAEVNGIVTNVGPYGVFVDFGAVKDGLLRVDKKAGRGFRRGMEVRGMVVLSCDPESGRVVLQPDETTLPEPPPRRAASQARSASWQGSRLPRQPRRWDHDEATPLEELTEGDVFEGVVTNVSPFGVFVDIGAVRDARLMVPVKIGRCFRIGDVVQNCTLEVVDLERNRLGASLPDPEEAVRDLPPKERAPRPKAKAKPKAKGKAKPKARVERPAEDGYIPIEDLKVGTMCDGIVSNRNPYGIFVNIGCEKDARLQVPRSVGSKFRRGDEVYGMKIESVDLERYQITVSLDDPELSVDDVEEEQPVPPAPAPATPAAAKRAASTPAPAAKRAASAGGARAAAPRPTAKPTLKAQRDTSYDHPNALPISRFRVGSTVNGVVTGIGPRGVSVDIGAVNDGLLQLPRAIAKQFQVDDEVHGMTVDEVDRPAERILLSLDDPELEEPEDTAPPARSSGRAAGPVEPGARAKSKGKAKPKPGAMALEPRAKPAAAKTKPRGKAAAQAGAGKDWSHPGAIRIEDLEVGTEIAGVVTNTGQFGVFVDIGAERDGKLRLARRFWRNFKAGDEVDGLVVEEVDPDSRQIWLSFMNGDEEEAAPETEVQEEGTRETEVQENGRGREADEGPDDDEAEEAEAKAAAEAAAAEAKPPRPVRGASGPLQRRGAEPAAASASTNRPGPARAGGPAAGRRPPASTGRPAARQLAPAR